MYMRNDGVPTYSYSECTHKLIKKALSVCYAMDFHALASATFPASETERNKKISRGFNQLTYIYIGIHLTVVAPDVIVFSI